MKKIFGFILVMTMVASMMTGCGQKGAGTTTPTDGSGASSTKEVKMSLFAGSIPKNSPTGVGMDFMAEEINTKSKGAIAATAYYDTELGDATSMVQGLQQGTIDVGLSGSSYFSGLVPGVQVFELPFLFQTIDEARMAVDGEAKDILFKEFEEKGVLGLCFWENGFRELSNNVRPVKTPADLKGIKMRTLPATVQVEAWKALGALPTSIDASELYTALQQGTVSAQENPLAEIVFRKFYEVQKYVSLTDHVYTPFFMGMSKVTYDKLTPELQTVVRDASIAGQTLQRDTATEFNLRAKQELLDAGVEIEENPDKAAFQKLTAPVYKVFTDKSGTEVLDVIRAGLK